MPERSGRARQPTTGADVIVLGAGAAGLACAADLVRAGRRAILLEARPRIGGRVHTLHEQGIGLPVELGAEFVHGRPPELLTIARAAGISLCQMGGELWRRTGRRLARSRGLGAQIASTLDRMRASSDTSVSEALARTGASPEARATAAAFVQGFDAAPPDETSAQWILRAQASATYATRQILRFVDGYDSVIEWLRRGAEAGEGDDVVRTSVVARRVEWRPGRVRVTCASPTGSPLDTLEAESLVATLPVGVLRAAADAVGAVSFDPPLPASNERALGLLAMGHVLKLTLRFRKPIWRPALGFLQAPAEVVPTWWTARPFEEPRIVGWCGGPKALALLAHGEAHILELAVHALARALGVSRRIVERELSSWWTHDWSADPFSRGAYAFARVGGSRAGRSLAAPIQGTLFFAGEATCDASIAGTVHGAIASGRRAARGVLAARSS
jgi:monoamine oxidase